ncbi:MAG: NADH-quinone oxidoreductase subunit NuoE [Pseudomonadota bacterium]
MSAPRMAANQPTDVSLSADAKANIDRWIKKYPEGRQRSALLPALWIAQKDAGGWLPEVILREIGDILGMAYIRVYEVATFYTMYNLAPVGKYHIQLCGTTPCWLRGSDALKDVLARRVGPQNTVSKDGNFSWLEVECLGACANAPMMQVSADVDEDPYYEDLTPESLEALLDDLADGKEVSRGPQNGRLNSAPEGGRTTLLGEGHFHKQKLINLPNTDKKVKLNYYEWDPKERRATKGGWVDPKRKASADPKKRSGNLGRDLTKGLVDDDPKKGLPKRSSKPKPQVIYTDGPTDGEPDDLKKIKGIGPVFEAELNDKGVYYYRQIAAWKKSDIKAIEEIIEKFPGRIERDEWVNQAKVLAKGPAKTKAKPKKKTVKDKA